MVRTKGTILSLDASGSLHKTLIASSWKGRQYLKTHAIPVNPQSGNQTSCRVMFAFLSSEWESSDYEDKGTWNELAENQNISPFNYYLQINLERWSSLLYPSRFLEIIGAGTWGAGSYYPYYEGNRIIRLRTTITTLNQNWGAIVHQGSSSGFTPNLSNVCAVVVAKTVAEHNNYLYHQSLGTHYFRWRRFSTNGEGYLFGLERQTTVT